MTNHQIAVVGSVLPASLLASHPAASVAGNRYQSGLYRSMGQDVTLLTLEPNGMWPSAASSGRIFIRSRDLSHTELPSTRTIPYVNILGIKQVTIFVNLLWMLLHWRFTSRARQRTIVVYNTMTFLALPALLVAKATRTTLVFIVADVPLDDTRSESLLHQAEAAMELSLIKRSHGIISLTGHTSPDLAGPRMRSLVIEGGWEPGDPAAQAVTAPKAPTNALNLMYAGALNSVSGIELALDAVRDLPAGPEIVLDIYGSGPLADLVTSAAKELPGRIRYHGPVPHHVVLEAEHAADLLLCPRIPDGYVTRYTFPSKIIEYLASGTPVMSNQLEGLTAEYTSLLLIPSAPTPAAWGEALLAFASNFGHYDAKARDAAEFIRTKKAWTIQGAKVGEFLDGLSR